MDRDKIFQEAQEIIDEIASILKRQFELLKSRGYGNQKKSDLRQGLVRKNGIYILLNSIEHRILFDGYEAALLEAYIDIYNNLFERWEEAFAQFGLRTLHELSFEKIQILFDKDIPQDKKNKYKLLIWLVDYASISKIKENANSYTKLLNEYKGLLTQEEYDFYSCLLTKLETNTPLEGYKLIKAARKKINPLQTSLSASTKSLLFIKELNILALSSSFSHILHGNVLLLKDIFQFKRRNAQQLRIYWALMLTGINVINRVGNDLNDLTLNEKISGVNENFRTFSAFLQKNYRLIEERVN